MKKRKHGLLKGALAMGVCGVSAGAGVVTVSEWLFHFAIARESWNLPDFLMKRYGDDYTDPYGEAIDQAEAKLRKQDCDYVEIIAEDGIKLKGRFYKGAEGNKEVFLAVHGFRNHGTREFSMIQSYYRRRGASYLIIDQRACGDSEGKYMTYGAKESKDMRLWTNWLADHCPADSRIYLHGISLGSATVLLTAALDLPPQVAGVIADCGYTSAWNEFTHQMEHLASGHGKWVISTVNRICMRRAGFDIHDAAPIDAVKHAKLPHLFIHGDADDFVPYHMGQELYAACTAPKTMLTVEGADHARSYQTAPEQYEKAIADFIEQTSTAYRK
ncbi:MAG: alpha/beta hydrolase [Lachnospiraceae bacterium]|nr:alpha/beta hydrolase [Lachnospiraceae bacterium]